jgi:hypothetical protein
MSKKKRPRKRVDKKSPNDTSSSKTGPPSRVGGSKRKNREAELTWGNVNLNDPDEVNDLIAQQAHRAGKRIHEAVKDLQKRGIIDEHGNPLKKDTPPDMSPGSKAILPE